MKKKLISLLLFWVTFSVGAASCPGKFVNPVTDVCWSCLFPMSIGASEVAGHGLADTSNPESPVCACPRPPAPMPVPGITVGFWEPVRLVDVTRYPYCLVSLGGLKIGNSKQYGTHSKGTKKRGAEHSFYHVHWYVYPVLYILALLTNLACLDKEDIDVAYMTEIDPLWDDDEVSAILTPETLLFANPIAQIACAADCAKATLNTSSDLFSWCGGCQGSLYPYTGTMLGHAGGVQASLLMTQRVAAKLHRQLMLPGTCGIRALCGKYLQPVIKKKQYRTQMVYPVAAKNKRVGCHSMGRSSVILEAGREFPYKGEDFAYFIWRKRNCCAL